jgi:hypothetical protein
MGFFRSIPRVEPGAIPISTLWSLFLDANRKQQDLMVSFYLYNLDFLWSTHIRDVLYHINSDLMIKCRVSRRQSSLT